MHISEETNGDFLISSDKTKLQLAVIHEYLSVSSYWAANIPVELVSRAIEHSVCFGVYIHDEQIGFARVVTDCATFGYLADVFILPAYRGHGLARWLMTCILAHPDLQGFRRWMLATRDAHRLYQQFGFTPPDKPESLMQKRPVQHY